MARITVHLHGTPKEKANLELIQMYSQRLLARGIRVEYHSEKLSLDAYVALLQKKKGTILYMDEAGELIDSIQFSKRVHDWNIAGEETHLAIGPAQGWPSNGIPEHAKRFHFQK